MTDDELKLLKTKAARYDWLESKATRCLIHPSQRIGAGRGGWRVPDFSHDGQSFGEAIDCHIGASGEKQG
jgi:hypothetical protein